MFAFGYGRGSRPPPFKFRRRRPQKPQAGGETFAERAAREAREREEQAEARERKRQEQQEKKVRILVDVDRVWEVLMVIGAGSMARTRKESQGRAPG